MAVGFFVATGLLAQHGHRFRPGEKLTYEVEYHLNGFWVNAGEVVFSVDTGEFAGKKCFRFKGEGRTHKRYDWFYKVRDTYTAMSAFGDLQPLRFTRNVAEGPVYYREDYIFDLRNDRIITVLTEPGKPAVVDSLANKPGTLDVLTMMYHARDMDFDHRKHNEKIPIRLVIDGEIHDLYVRYLGVETLEGEAMGEVLCHVFSPLLMEGTLFRGGERMKVWVTADKNQVPVYVESQILVGSIRSWLVAYEGLKFPPKP